MKIVSCRASHLKEEEGSPQQQHGLTVCLFFDKIHETQSRTLSNTQLISEHCKNRPDSNSFINLTKKQNFIVPVNTAKKFSQRAKLQKVSETADHYFTKRKKVIIMPILFCDNHTKLECFFLVCNVTGASVASLNVGWDCGRVGKDFCWI